MGLALGIAASLRFAQWRETVRQGDFACLGGGGYVKIFT